MNKLTFWFRQQPLVAILIFNGGLIGLFIWARQPILVGLQGLIFVANLIKYYKQK